MSLNNIVKNLYRGACALVASAAIYVGGCESNINVPQSQPPAQESSRSQSQPTGVSSPQTSPSITPDPKAPSVPDNSTGVIPEPTPSVDDWDPDYYEEYSGEDGYRAAIVASFGFPSQNPNMSTDRVTSIMQGLLQWEIRPPMHPWFEYDGKDGVFDDRFSLDQFESYKAISTSQFDFSSPTDDQSRSFRRFGQYLVAEKYFIFESKELRDDFVKKLSAMPAGFGFMLDAAMKHIGEDRVFQSSEVDSLVEFIKRAIFNVKTQSGVGLVAAENKYKSAAEVWDDQLGLSMVWNSNVSADYIANINPEDREKLLRAFIDSGLKYHHYNAYATIAHLLDLKDGVADGIIGASALEALDGKSLHWDASPDEDLGVGELIYNSLLEEFAEWPIYRPSIRLIFESKYLRDEFDAHISESDHKGAALSAGIIHSGVDGVLQNDEAIKLLVHLGYDANQGTGGTASPPREE